MLSVFHLQDSSAARVVAEATNWQTSLCETHGMYYCSADDCIVTDTGTGNSTVEAVLKAETIKFTVVQVDSFNPPFQLA